jgi:hypothetical protein
MAGTPRTIGSAQMKDGQRLKHRNTSTVRGGLINFDQLRKPEPSSRVWSLLALSTL